jgi:hypothetical protein
MEQEETPMGLTVRAHFDGRAIVPNKPLELPVNQRLEVELHLLEDSTAENTIEERLKRLANASGRIVEPSIPLEALRRENLYEERSLTANCNSMR